MANYDTLVEPRLDDIREWARTGSTEKEIAKALGISYSAFRLYKNKNPRLQGILTESKKEADETVLGTFYKIATGYSYKTSKTETLADGTKIKSETTHYVEPSSEACKFWLTNRMPEEFKNKQTLEGGLKVEKTLEDYIDEL